ncbi:uncharacterized protein spag16 [Stigmatopora nigra]
MSAETTEREKGETSDISLLKDKASAVSTNVTINENSKEEQISNIPETVDDFVRNFLQRIGLSRTLDSFEREWYSSAQKLLTKPLETVSPAEGTLVLPDALTHKRLLQTELQKVYSEINYLKQKVLCAGDNLVKMQRDRDQQQLQWQILLAEKSHAMEDIKRLKKRLSAYEPALRELDGKYEVALRHKMLISLESERMQNTLDARLSHEKSLNKTPRSIKKSTAQGRSTARNTKDTELPICSTPLNLQSIRGNPEEQKKTNLFTFSYSIKAHTLPVSCISLHPEKKVLASASDDCTWKLWALPVSREKVGQMVLTGEGHADWLSSCSFHPEGTKLATTSGDTTVKLWDFFCGRCVLTFTGHSQPTWGCSFHSCGHFLASCSSDKTAKLWDLNSQRCRLTMRRHTASVNSVCFQSFSNILLTSSADKTLCLWDVRLGVCTTTFVGHEHPCNHAAISLAEDVIASCDTQGIVNLWDMRKATSAISKIDAGPLSANQVAFSPSGKKLAVAGSDNLVRLVNVASCTVCSLSGQKDSVQCVIFDHTGGTVMSAGSNGLINVWN